MSDEVARTEDYKTFDLSFTAHPATGDLVMKKGADAIKQSVRNLVLTNFYERPFRSYIGSNVLRQLFDNFDPFTIITMKQAVTEVLVNFEPRITVDAVNVEQDRDQHGVNITIYFTINNTLEPAVTSVFLERIR